MNKDSIKKLLWGRCSWRRILFSLAEVYICIILWALFFSDPLIFVPPPPSYSAGNGIHLIPVNENESIGFSGCSRENSPYAVLYIHGNAEDIGHIRFVLDAYCTRGFSAYSFDYRGYGISDGKPGTKRAYQDGEAALRYMTDVLGIPCSRIILHGRSVGAAIATHLASKSNVAGLIVESGFLTAFRTITHIPIAPVDKMRNDKNIKDAACPVLVMHGEADPVIPVWHGKKLYELAPDPKMSYWVPDAGHNDFIARAGNTYWEQIDTFVQLIDEQKKP